MTNPNPYAYLANLPTPKRKKRIWPWIFGGLLVVLVAACSGLMLTAGPSHPVVTPGAARASIAATSGLGTAPASASAAKAKSGTLTKSDLKLTVKTTKKDCFGSAGCNVEYQIKVAVDGAKLRAAGKTWDITYDVHGLQDTQTGTLTLNPDGTFTQEDLQMGQTSSSGKKLSATVTDLQAQI
jgi:hypothetical protein